jgi:hypothetical protein
MAVTTRRALCVLALVVMLASASVVARAQEDDQDALTVHDLMTRVAPARRLLVEEDLKPDTSEKEFFSWDGAYGTYGRPRSPWVHSSEDIGTYGGV